MRIATISRWWSYLNIAIAPLLAVWCLYLTVRLELESRERKWMDTYLNEQWQAETKSMYSMMKGKFELHGFHDPGPPIQHLGWSDKKPSDDR